MEDRVAQNRKEDHELLETSVTSRIIGEKILVYGSCIPLEHPDIVKGFKEHTRLSTCLTTKSMEEVAWKLLTMVRMKGPKELAALTMDGSPHCLQLHFALEDIHEIYPSIRVRHFVIEKGVIQEVSSEAVKTARHLSRIKG